MFEWRAVVAIIALISVQLLAPTVQREQLICNLPTFKFNLNVYTLIFKLKKNISRISP